MRNLKAGDISEAVSRLCLEANRRLRPDVLRAVKKALSAENSRPAKLALRQIIENAGEAARTGLALCQDTGLPIVFVSLGSDVHVQGDLVAAVQTGIRRGYRRGFFRPSIVADPLARGSSSYGPGLVHLEIRKGAHLRIDLLPKGFGCENKSALRMFDPTVSFSEIRDFIVGTVRSAGADACPPYIVGVGLGGSADYAGLLAKKALLRNLSKRSRGAAGKLEKESLEHINRLAIGAMGMGGRTTCLAVNIETHPTHIAGLPVAVNLSCHALRSAGVTL